MVDKFRKDGSRIGMAPFGNRTALEYPMYEDRFNRDAFFNLMNAHPDTTHPHSAELNPATFRHIKISERMRKYVER